MLLTDKVNLKLNYSTEIFLFVFIRKFSTNFFHIRIFNLPYSSSVFPDSMDILQIVATEKNKMYIINLSMRNIQLKDPIASNIISCNYRSRLDLYPSWLQYIF